MAAKRDLHQVGLEMLQNQIAVIFRTASGIERVGRVCSADRFRKTFACMTVNLVEIVNHMVKCSAPSLNRTFAALADPTRRRILEHLAQGDHCVTDLARPHRMSLPAISKHLRVLERARLIRRQRRGRVHQLRLEAKPMKDAQQWIEAYRRFWEASLDRLDTYLKQIQATEKPT